MLGDNWTGSQGNDESLNKTNAELMGLTLSGGASTTPPVNLFDPTELTQGLGISPQQTDAPQMSIMNSSDRCDAFDALEIPNQKHSQSKLAAREAENRLLSVPTSISATKHPDDLGLVASSVVGT